MRRIITLWILFLLAIRLHGQTSYSGFIDKYPIELVTDISSDGIAKVFYVYSKFDDPIIADGTLKNGFLALIEKENSGKTETTLVFKNFSPDSTRMEGVWRDNISKKELKVVLNKSFDIGSGDSLEWKNKELLQPVSLKNKYFKLMIGKEKGSFVANVTGIKIIEKKTDKVTQQINFDCQLLGLNGIEINDYNFDGIADFSVFEHSYAGPNTSRLYFLYNKKTKTYFKSDFSGTLLEFDSSKKRIYETNQCCAGTSVMTAEYKVINDKMVLLNEHCFKWDEKKQELVERKMKECQ